jgi:hypothetical protein
MIKNILEQARIALAWEQLKFIIREIPVIRIIANGNALHDIRTERRKIKPPHFPRIGREKDIRQAATNAREQVFLRILRRLNRFRLTSQQTLRLLLPAHGDAEYGLQRVQIDGQRHVAAIAKARDNPVFIGQECTETPQPFHHARIIGVEKMRPVTMKPDSGPGFLIIGIAGDMRSPVNSPSR